MIGSMLFGRSGYGGMGGGGGGGFGFGDIIILLIIAGILYWVYRRYKAKKQMAMSTSSAGPNSFAYSEQPAYDYGSTAYNAQPAGDSVGNALRHIAEMDPSFNENAFCEKAEDMFFKIQGGWTRRDLTVISDLLTPQMRDTFQGDINRYVADKKINRLENIAVRNVEIVDASQEQGEEYITVRYTASLLDFTTDESGGVLSGSSTDPVKFLEYWTYTRKVGERNWKLSGITQEQDYR
jgi:predicted lipid-binding transport protein (Tim44 family)